MTTPVARLPLPKVCPYSVAVQDDTVRPDQGSLMNAATTADTAVHRLPPVVWFLAAAAFLMMTK